MAEIDVSAEIDISASPAEIAGIMFDPARDPDWVAAVASVEIIDPALVPGARVRRSGSLLGQPVTWTTAVEAVHFPHVLILRLEDGPLAGVVRYDIQRAGAGSRAGVRAAGRVAGAGLLPASLITASLRAAIAADLSRLKTLVEACPR